MTNIDKEGVIWRTKLKANETKYKYKYKNKYTQNINKRATITRT